jgi:L,D-transpeptidase-like protein
MRVVSAWVLALALGCGSKEKPKRQDVPLTTTGSGSAQLAPEADPQAQQPPDFPDGTRSLELVRTVGVRLEPGDDAKRIGTVAVDTRVGWDRTAPGKGCQKPWVQIRPRGWICADYVKPSKRLPFGREVPALERGEIVPGLYGKVTALSAVSFTVETPETKGKKKDKKKRDRERPAPPPPPAADGGSGSGSGAPELKLVEGRPLVGSVNVRRYDEVTVGGKVYWKISQKDSEYVLRQAITPHRPSVFGGGRLGDDTGLALPIAFVWPRVYGWQQIATYYRPTGVGGVNRQLWARTLVPILETQTDKANKPLVYRIGQDEWIFAPDVRVFNPAPPPKYLEPGERWIDVDVDSQILVAYEGDMPVYATMVSSGGKETPTETGTYRMWLKESEADMKGLNGEDPYSVATVPWTQFFSPEKELALHTAYWHDQFGVRRSHGCVNLAPRDARWLYFWSDPQVPPGWTMAAGVAEAPGSIVRIRSKDDPDPEPKGYAKKVFEQRQQNAPVH